MQNHQDYDRARQIYQTAVKLVPHKQFTFAKLWLLYARFEVRQLDLPAARKTLGAAIGMCPKEALFKGYIQLEFDVRPALFASLDSSAKSFCSCENSIGFEHCTRSTLRYVPRDPERLGIKSFLV